MSYEFKRIKGFLSSPPAEPVEGDIFIVYKGEGVFENKDNHLATCGYKKNWIFSKLSADVKIIAEIENDVLINGRSTRLWNGTDWIKIAEPDLDFFFELISVPEGMRQFKEFYINPDTKKIVIIYDDSFSLFD